MYEAAQTAVPLTSDTESHRFLQQRESVHAADGAGVDSTVSTFGLFQGQTEVFGCQGVVGHLCAASVTLILGERLILAAVIFTDHLVFRIRESPLHFDIRRKLICDLKEHQDKLLALSHPQHL